MKKNGVARLFAVALVLVFGLAFLPTPARAHCDGMDGPVVKAAQKALAAGDVILVLHWVSAADEAQIRQAFEDTLKVRKLGPEARELADRYFFETLVRVHRAGEGEPYTGLKAAGRDLGPAIPAADKALEQGSVEPLVKLLTETLNAAVRESFESAMAKKNFNKDDVAAGREFVAAYVRFLHTAEKIFEATHAAAHEEKTGAAAPATNAPAHRH